MRSLEDVMVLMVWWDLLLLLLTTDAHDLLPNNVFVKVLTEHSASSISGSGCLCWNVIVELNRISGM